MRAAWSSTDSVQHADMLVGTRLVVVMSFFTGGATSAIILALTVGIMKSKSVHDNNALSLHCQAWPRVCGVPPAPCFAMLLSMPSRGHWPD